MLFKREVKLLDSKRIFLKLSQTGGIFKAFLFKKASVEIGPPLVLNMKFPLSFSIYLAVSEYWFIIINKARV